MEENTTFRTRFQVTLGPAEVTVEGRDEREAISLARRRLALDKPHLWELIYRTEDARFRVARAA